MATFAISRPVGKRISCEHFFESMKLIQVAFILLLLAVPTFGQQTAAYWCTKGTALKLLGCFADADAALAKAKELGYSR